MRGREEWEGVKKQATRASSNQIGDPNYDPRRCYRQKKKTFEKLRANFITHY